MLDATNDRRPDHPRASHQALDEVEVAVARDGLAELRDRLVDVRVLEQRQQPGAQLRDPHRRDARQRAEHRHARERPDRVLDDAAPVVVGNVVEDDADHTAGTVQLLDAEHRCCRRLAHRPRVDDEHDRRRDEARDFERAPGKLGRAPGSRRRSSCRVRRATPSRPRRSRDPHRAIRARASDARRHRRAARSRGCDTACDLREPGMPCR